MFERDKDELRELGIPLVTGRSGASSTTSPATGSTSASTPCRTSSSSPTSSPSSAWPAAPGRRRRSPAPPRRRCASSRPPASSATATRLIGIEPRLRHRASPPSTPVKNAVVAQQTDLLQLPHAGEGAAATAAPCSRGAWPPGTAAGTSPASTWTGGPRGSSACAASRARSRQVKRAEPYAVPADHRAQEMIRTLVGEHVARSRGPCGCATAGASAAPPGRPAEAVERGVVRAGGALHRSRRPSPTRSPATARTWWSSEPAGGPRPRRGAGCPPAARAAHRGAA